MPLQTLLHLAPRIALHPLAALPLLVAASWPAHAQIGCRSDGQPAPTALFERFLSADCDTCWSDPRTPAPGPSALLLDWIAPSPQGDDAPLAAAAMVETTARLQALDRSSPTPTAVHVTALEHRGPQALRVVHGLPVAGYLGVMLEWRGRPLPPGAYRSTMALVEHLSAGTEGAGVARVLVRAATTADWDGRRPLKDLRGMRVPEGAQAARLGVAGWVQDAEGRLVAAARAHCE
ncbi:MAG: hypothetical protein ACK40S_05125 [Burkholderiaceae bacterium]